jgi:hypothetical protein
MKRSSDYYHRLRKGTDSHVTLGDSFHFKPYAIPQERALGHQPGESG